MEVLFTLCFIITIFSTAAVDGLRLTSDPRCPVPIGFGICETCPNKCHCGSMCCFNGCGTSCVPIPLPKELSCLAYKRCLPLEDCVPARDCPGVPGARCTHDCNCRKAFLDCDGQLLTRRQCDPNADPVPTDRRCEQPIGVGTCSEGCPIDGCGCGQICCSNGCGKSCTAIPLPTELSCLAYTTCFPQRDCDPKRDCPGVPGARCTHNCHCGKAFISCNGQLLTNEQCNPGATSPTPRPCLPGKDVTYCFFDPCRIATCHSFPEATCSSDHCGGCNAVFTNRNGIVLTKEECQEDCQKPSIVCVNAPCRFANCPNYPDARCRPGRCLSNICDAVFTYRGFILTHDDCHGNIPRQCPLSIANNEVVTFQITCTDENNVGSRCTASCPPGKKLVGRSNIVCDERSKWAPGDFRSTQCIKLDVCPPGSGMPRCAPACFRAKCPAHPKAVCVDNDCGGCLFDFFLNGRKLTREECIPRGPCPYLFPYPFCQRKCRHATCRGHPDAVCEVDCSCSPAFYNPATLERVHCSTLLEDSSEEL
ncbi:unnamed protein product [Clavelina lepadiformis]|uniref:Sushi domain-containing protein n=1 Tax=Clavelina lepadiformis TaxID=159417 RepID=A0ABP0H3R9_CLALP